ncbi:hypothetical protein GCM10010149_17670 [Nonomuraea roseoviolacea subsp. roseoviolacea]|uniref:hemerythrin domain-containing protein n=1 Tax=Nonomuraea roseoviolacea TaxID=103837 RepID=UPI0031D347E4
MAPSLLGIRIAHRAMRGDTRRLAALMHDIVTGRQDAGPARRELISVFVTRLCAGIRRHHRAEHDVLWPVVVRSAGAEVDLSGLIGDHARLDPLLDEVARVADAFPGDPPAAIPLARNLATLAGLLDEHIEEEERLLFPVIAAHVSEADWKQAEDAVREGGGIGSDLPRLGQYARAEELAELRRLAGPVLALMLTLTRPGHRRRRRLVFGAAA